MKEECYFICFYSAQRKIHVLNQVCLLSYSGDLCKAYVKKIQYKGKFPKQLAQVKVIVQFMGKIDRAGIKLIKFSHYFPQQIEILEICESQQLKKLSNLEKQNENQMTNVNEKQQKNNKKEENKVNYKRWSRHENLIYASYLREEEESFETYRQRRSKKVFVALSELIGTKNVRQCKSHHQKMIQYCGTIQNIIKKFLVLQNSTHSESPISTDVMSINISTQIENFEATEHQNLYQNPQESWNSQISIFNVLNLSESERLSPYEPAQPNQFSWF